MAHRRSGVGVVRDGACGIGSRRRTYAGRKCVSIESCWRKQSDRTRWQPNAPTPLEITPESIQALESQGKLEALADPPGHLGEFTCHDSVRRDIPVATRQYNAGGGGPATSYVMQNTGTIVDVTPRVEEDGASSSISKSNAPGWPEEKLARSTR